MNRLFLALIVPCLVYAQNFSNGFGFYLHPDGTTSQQFMPHFPISPFDWDDFVSIDPQGHFAVHD